MNSSKLDVFFSALTAFCIVAGGSIVVVVGSQAGGTTALNKTAWILAIATGLVAAAKDVRSLLKLPPVSVAAAKQVVKAAAVMIALAFLWGCMSATATRTGKDGSTSSIAVKSLLLDISGGNYTSTNSDGTSTTLSIANGTPDQQAIATLANGMVNVATLFAAKPPTNTAATNIIVLPTNSAATLILEPPPAAKK
jgi:hypothetical protein